MSRFLSAEFMDRDTLISALIDLKAKGFTAEDIAVFSDEPIEFSRSVLHRRSHMSLAVVIGAVTFCLLIVGFVYFTQYDYPIVTGGMPLFSFWATGVVFYEITMLGAILTTLFWFLRESGLISRRNHAPVPALRPDTIALRVRCGQNQFDAVRTLIECAGGENIRALEARA